MTIRERASHLSDSNQDLNTLPRLRRESTLLLIVDVQEKLLRAMHEGDRVERNSALLARAAQQLGLPVIVTEQNPDRLGRTVSSIAELAPAAPVFSKMLFS